VRARLFPERGELLRTVRRGALLPRGRGRGRVLRVPRGIFQRRRERVGPELHAVPGGVFPRHHGRAEPGGVHAVLVGLRERHGLQNVHGLRPGVDAKLEERRVRDVRRRLHRRRLVNLRVNRRHDRVLLRAIPPRR
jgi:hypothetical protein